MLVQGVHDFPWCHIGHSSAQRLYGVVVVGENTDVTRNGQAPGNNILGGEGRGFIHLMEELPQERLGIAVGAQAAAQRAFDEAVKFTKGRKAFGKTVFEFQNTKFVLADLKAKIQVGWAHLDWAIRKHLAGELTTDEASAAKLWHTDLQWEACDMALQLHGGAGLIGNAGLLSGAIATALQALVI